MLSDQLLTFFDLPLVLRDDTTATVTRLETVRSKRAIDLVYFPYAGTVDGS